MIKTTTKIKIRIDIIIVTQSRIKITIINFHLLTIVRQTDSC